MVRRQHENDYQAVHVSTQQLTDNLDAEINFHLDARPDYNALAPLFFGYPDLKVGLGIALYAHCAYN